MSGLVPTYWPRLIRICCPPLLLLRPLACPILATRSTSASSRHWVITDGDGQVEEVRGAGVVGQQPLIDIGASHTYSSGTVMTSKVGTMQGSYQMKATDGQLFDAVIAPFRLAVPGALH
jgi:uncharacterized protein affecting Mg2+/Co2+ transport